MKTIISLLLLAVVNLIHCQENEQMIVFTLQGVLQKLEDISDTLKGYEAIQQKQEEIMDTLKGYEAIQQKQDEIMDTLRGHEELLQRIPDVQEKLEYLENNLQGFSQEIGQCLRGDDMEHLTNVSAAAHQEIKSFHEEMSGIISWAEKDECSEGSLPCGQRGICKNTLFSFTCSCPSGFTWDGSDCADIDECIQGSAKCDSNAKCANTLGSYSCSCNPPFEGDGRTCSCPEGFVLNGDICEDINECSSAEGKGVCVPNAVCRNSIGSYNCYCHKPFEGDGRTSCEFPCKSPAEFLSGVDCIRRVEERKSYHDMNDFCREKRGRMWTNLTREQLNDLRNTFGLEGGRWVGVYDGKWTSDEESLVPQNLWDGGRYRPDTSRRCGAVGWDSSFSSLKVLQRDCSDKRYGYCQFQKQQLP